LDVLPQQFQQENAHFREWEQKQRDKAPVDAVNAYVAAKYARMIRKALELVVEKSKRLDQDLVVFVKGAEKVLGEMDRRAEAVPGE
jgi:hypothetical protein